MFGRATKAWVVDDSRARDVRTFAMVMMSVENEKVEARFGDGGIGRREKLFEKLLPASAALLPSSLFRFLFLFTFRQVSTPTWLLFIIYRWQVLVPVGSQQGFE